MTQGAVSIDQLSSTARIRRRTWGALAALAIAVFAVGSPIAASADVGTGPGTISGVISSGGVPVEGVAIEIYPLLGGDPFSQVTGVDGTYAFVGLELGEYSISVYQGSQFQYPLIPNVTVSEAEPVVSVDVSLEPVPTGNASITGLVTDADTGLGIADVLVSVWAPVSGASAGANTDSEGAFTLSNLPGGETYFLSIFPFGYSYFNEPVYVDIDGVAVVDVALVAANSGLFGTVVDELGTAIPNVFVDATGPGGGSGGVTDEFGMYAIPGLVPGEYSLEVGGSGTPWTLETTTVTVAANENLQVDFIVTPRTTGEIAGYILNTEGFGLQNICPTVYKAGSSKVVAYGQPSSLEATFHVTNLKPGDYTLRFTDCDADRSPKYASEWWADVVKKKDATVHEGWRYSPWRR